MPVLKSMLQGQGIGWELVARKSLEPTLRAVNSGEGMLRAHSPDLFSRARKRTDQET